MSYRQRLSSCAILLASLFSTMPSLADVVFLDAVRDNTLYENVAGDLSNGSGQYLFVGKTAQGQLRRTLLRFDVAAAIPAGSLIQSAELTLHMSKTNTSGTLVSVHRALADWGEGASDAADEEGIGAPAAPGDATWIHTFFDTATWVSPGGDFALDASATTNVLGNGLYSWLSDGLRADVQQFLDQPALNFGWAILGDERFDTTAKRFDAREHPDPAVRPVLRVEFVPEPSALTLLAAALLTRLSMRR